MGRRFEVARAIGAGNAPLFGPPIADPDFAAKPPRLASSLYYEAIEPRLSLRTRGALDGAASQQEWNTLLLASPEFNYR